MIFSGLEVIVFDEEVLLAFCFISFVYTVYNYLNTTIFDSFSTRASKIEEDILLAFAAKQLVIQSRIKNALLLNGISNKFDIFEFSIKRYNKFIVEGKKIFHLNTLTTYVESKLVLLAVAEENIKELSRTFVLQSLSYSAIFVLAKLKAKYECKKKTKKEVEAKIEPKKQAVKPLEKQASKTPKKQEKKSKKKKIN